MTSANKTTKKEAVKTTSQGKKKTIKKNAKKNIQLSKTTYHYREMTLGL